MLTSALSTPLHHLSRTTTIKILILHSSRINRHWEFYLFFYPYKIPSGISYWMHEPILFWRRFQRAPAPACSSRQIGETLRPNENEVDQAASNTDLRYAVCIVQSVTRMRGHRHKKYLCFWHPSQARSPKVVTPRLKSIPQMIHFA